MGIISSVNIKRVFDYDYLFLIYVNLFENFYYFFVDLFVGGVYFCDSMKLFVVLLLFLGFVYCSVVFIDIEKRLVMGLYIMIVFFYVFYILFFKCLLYFLVIFFFNKYK